MIGHSFVCGNHGVTLFALPHSFVHFIGLRVRFTHFLFSANLWLAFLLQLKIPVIYTESHGLRFATFQTKQKIFGSNEILLAASIGDEEKKIKGSHILIATGRTPNTDALQLSNTDIKTEQRGHIIVNEKLETSVEGIYAFN